MLHPGKKLGVVGLGGLGHVAVKFGKAFGLHVTVISTSISKRDEATRRLGADNFLLSTDAEQMQRAARTLDFVLDTVSAKHSLGPILDLLKVNGTLVFVGAPEAPVELPSFPLIFGKNLFESPWLPLLISGRTRHHKRSPSLRRSMAGKRVVAGSLIGGMRETQEMLDLCGQHNITCDIELVKTSNINEAMNRLARNDVRYRFVIDIAGQSRL